MKWIGQHIWSLISRFRSDVYLEDVSTGTIANGGNLGLDSNMKIVKGFMTNVTADDFIIESTTNIKPVFTLKAKFNSNKPAIQQFVKDRGAAGVSGDYVGETYYISDNDAQEQISMVGVSGKVADATDGAEEGQYIISIKNTDSPTAPRPSLTLTGNGAVTDATIGYGAASTTTVVGDLAVTTGLILDSVDVTAIQTSGEQFADNDTSLMTSASIDDKINTKYSTSYITFTAKSTSSFGTNYIAAPANGITNVTFNQDTGVDSAGDFGGVTTEQGGSGTDATMSVASGNMDQQIPIPETCKLIGFYATGTTSTNVGATYDVGVGIWHVPESDVQWGSSPASTATLIHKSDSSRHAENTAHGGTNRKKVQKVERMDGTAKDLAAGDILCPTIFGETSNQQIFATITLVIATPIKTIA